MLNNAAGRKEWTKARAIWGKHVQNNYIIIALWRTASIKTCSTSRERKRIARLISNYQCNTVARTHARCRNAMIYIYFHNNCYHSTAWPNMRLCVCVCVACECDCFPMWTKYKCAFDAIQGDWTIAGLSVRTGWWYAISVANCRQCIGLKFRFSYNSGFRTWFFRFSNEFAGVFGDNRRLCSKNYVN